MSESGLRRSLDTLNLFECGAIDVQKAEAVLLEYGMADVEVVLEENYPLEQ